MKALIAMSGGVDSSVTAKLMQDAGFECIGCTMKLFEPEDLPQDAGRTRPSGTEDNVRDADAVARRLGMPFFVFDYRDMFRACVMEPFARAYAEGRTPNPCIECNHHLKFGQLLEEAKKLGCEYIATGHYARVGFDEQTGKYQLKKGLDASKDQSYVLYHLTQEQLAHVKLPLGEMEKPAVRAIAEREGFESANRPDSQDICFVPEGRYTQVVEQIAGRSFPQGEFVDLDGQVMGTHKGIIYYTIGQTRRLGQAFGRPRYVCRIEADTNRIVLGGPNDVYQSTAMAGQFNWISGEALEGEIRCLVKTRYKQKEQWATVRPQEPGAVEIRFDEPQRAITPGQAAVLYGGENGELVLGGGTIL